MHAESAGDDVVGVDKADLDVTDRVAVLVRSSTAVRPDAVVNPRRGPPSTPARPTRSLAFAVERRRRRPRGGGCDCVGAHLVHVCTDYVFDGTLDGRTTRDDATNPRRSTAARSWRASSAAGPGAAVVRTSWVCGDHGTNMVKTVLRLAGEPGSDLAFVDDQRGHPTFTADLAPALRRLAVERRAGIYHLTNQGAVSWYEFVREVLSRRRPRPRPGGTPIATADLDPPRPAPRPANRVLDNAVWRAAGLPPLRDFRAPLAELVAKLTDPGSDLGLTHGRDGAGRQRGAIRLVGI